MMERCFFHVISAVHIDLALSEQISNNFVVAKRRRIHESRLSPDIASIHTYLDG